MLEFKDMYERPHIINKTVAKRNAEEKVEMKWSLPFGDEINCLRGLNDNDLMLEFVQIRNKLKDHKKMYCLYSRCLTNSRRSNNNCDVR